MNEIGHPDIQPPDKTEADFNAGLANIDDLFDQVKQEEPGRPSMMTSADNNYQRRIDKLVPPEAYLSPEELTTLVERRRRGDEAKAQLRAREIDLSEAEIGELKREVSAGIDARNDIVVSFLPMATWVARESMGISSKRDEDDNPIPLRAGHLADVAQLRGNQVEYADRVQAVNIGLIHAASKYIPERGATFSTYAMHSIASELSRLADSAGLGNRTPVHLAGDIRRHDREARALELELERRPTEGELAARLKVEPSRIEQIRAWRQAYEMEPLDDTERRIKDARDRIALDEPLDDQPEVLTLADVTVDRDTSIDDEVQLILLGEQLERTFETLTEREAGIIRLRFGLEDGDPKMLDQISQVYGVSRERIRQIEGKAMAKFRHPDRSSLLREWIPLSDDDYTGWQNRLLSGYAEREIRTGGGAVLPSTDRASGLASWQTEADEDFEAPVRRQLDSEASTEELSAFDELLFEMRPEWFVPGEPGRDDGARADLVVNEVVKKFGYELKAGQVEHFWNAQLLEFARHIQDQSDGNLDINRLVLITSALIDRSIGDDETIRLVIPDGLHGKLDGFGRGLSHGQLVIEGSVGNNVAEGARGTSHIIVHGDTGDRAGQKMCDYARLEVTGSTGNWTAENCYDGTHIQVDGNVGNGAGCNMHGEASLIIHGDAGSNVGLGLSGEAAIKIGGNAGLNLAREARGGMIEVHGTIGSIGAQAAFDGAIMVAGRRLSRDSSGNWRV